MPVNAYFICVLASECVFYSFHLSLLILLIAQRNNTFKGPFYTTFKIVIFAEMVNFLCGVTISRISLIAAFRPFYETNFYFGTFMQDIYSYMVTLVFLGHVIMSFNRFTLMWFPFHYKLIWKHQWYTVVLLLLPFINVSWRIHQPATFVFASNDNANLKFDDPDIRALYFLTATFIYFTTTCIAAVFNILSFVKFYFSKSAAINAKEKHLLFVSLITFVTQFIRTCYSAEQYLFPNNAQLNAIFITAFPVINDAFALSGSISFIILSATARRQYVAFYLCKKKSHHISSVTHHSRVFTTIH